MQHRGRIIFALGAATLVVGSWVVSSRIATVSAQRCGFQPQRDSRGLRQVYEGAIQLGPMGQR